MTTPMQRLWTAVLLENVRVAVGSPDAASQPSHVYDYDKAEARRWIGSRDFEVVCTFAGFEPDMVRDALRSGRVTAASLILRHRHAADAQQASNRARATMEAAA